MTADSSRPPVDPRATMHDGIETTDQRVARYREEQKESATDLVSLTDRVDDLEQLVGRPPSALPGAKGTGLSQHLVDLTHAVQALTTRLEESDKARAAEVVALAKREAEAKERREPWARIWWIALGAIIVVIVSGAAGAAGHAIAAHWH